MIEKLNFYDIYGYFLPGFTLVGLILLPFGLFKQQWPATGVSSALIGVVSSYVLGHVIQTLAVRAFPSQLRDSFGNRRYPSEFFLDPGQSVFPEDFKHQLAKLVQDMFRLDLAIDRGPAKQNDSEFAPVAGRRQAAFFLSRGVLIRQKIAGYAEQFEGLYTLMRGLVTAFLLGAVYFAGWALSLLASRCVTILAVIVTGLGLLGALVVAMRFLRPEAGQKGPVWIERTGIVSLLLSSLAGGYLLALGTVNTYQRAGALVAMSLVALLFALRCFGSYKSFAQEFAKAVWRDFAGFCTTSQPVIESSGK